MNVPNCKWEQAPVLGCERLAPDIVRLTVQGPAAPAAAPRPGQFYMLRAWKEGEGPYLSRPISLHDADIANGRRRFLFQVKGAGTQKLAALRAGEALTLTGPLGNGFDVPAILHTAGAGPVAVVGGGIGTAPLLYLCRALAENGRRPDFFAGFRDAPYGLDAFAPFVGGTALATDSGAAGHHGLVTDLLAPERYGAVLACGPDPMLRAVAAKCKAAGTPCLVSLEKHMACGLGACLGCTVHTAGGPRTVCKDGPVFLAREVF